MNSSSLPGTAASPLELPLGGKRHFHEAESLYYWTKEGGESKYLCYEKTRCVTHE